MQRRVKLPSGPLIGYLHLCQKIAEAVYPINTHPEGADCVWARSSPPDVPRALSKADLEELSNVLPKLPALKHPISEVDVATFLEAYSKLRERPLWTPCLITKQMVDERIGESIRERKRLVTHHVQALRAEHRAGRLFPVSPTHIPVDAVEMAARLTRDDAKAYLGRIGLPYEEEEEAENGSQPEAAPVPAISGTNKLKPGDREKIAKRHEQLKRKGAPSPTKKLAEEFGVSDSMIRRVIRETGKQPTQKKATSRTRISWPPPSSGESNA